MPPAETTGREVDTSTKLPKSSNCSTTSSMSGQCGELSIDGKAVSSAGTVKPWICARAKFAVCPPEKSTTRRVKKLREMNEAARIGLNRAPYVAIKWVAEGETGKVAGALIDTGADWSLIDYEGLTEGEKAELQPSSERGQGVSGEPVKNMGVVWRSISLMSTDGVPLVVDDQPFVVVQSMVTPLILGADFWSRLQAITLDFNQNTLRLDDYEMKCKLFQSAVSAAKLSSVKEQTHCEVVIPETVEIPGRHEIVVLCTGRGMLEGGNYMVEPLHDKKNAYRAAYGLTTVSDGKVAIRLANPADEPVKLVGGQKVALLYEDFEANDSHSGRAFVTASIHQQHKNKWDECCDSNLSGLQRKELQQLLCKYNQVFYEKGTLPIVRIGVEHTLRIDRDIAPVASRPRRLSPEMESEVRSELEDLCKMGVIRESNSPWAAPIVCARRANGKLRLAVDYRGVNMISSPATLHPIPHIEDLLDRLGKAQYFSTLDAKSGYHQMPLKDELDSEATAFVVPWGQFEYAGRTPFGLKGAGYSFQRMMSAILGECNFTQALCYLDDILIWGKTWKEHMSRLENVLKKIKNAGLALSLDKCIFGTREVNYLGCVIRNGMLCLSEQRVKQLREIKPPNNVRELRRALGAFAYIQRWLPGLADIAKPLYKEAARAKPYSRLTWTKEMEDAFLEIKERIANAVALNIPDQKKKFVLVTDASDTAIGAMLGQVSPDHTNCLCPVAFFHHSLSKAEEKYDATEKELLAVVLGVKKFQIYLGSRKFDLITDHYALRWLNSLNVNDTKGRKGRWIEFLQQFDINAIHKAGKSPEMSMADFLSRVTPSGDCKAQNGHVASVKWNKSQLESTLFSLDMVKEGQKQDPVISEVIRRLHGSLNENWRQPITQLTNEQSRCVLQIMRHSDRMFMDNNGILRIRFNGGRRTVEFPYGKITRNRLVVPEKMRQTTLHLVHDAG